VTRGRAHRTEDLMAKIHWEKVRSFVLRSLPKGAQGYLYAHRSERDVWYLYWWPEAGRTVKAQLLHEVEPYSFKERVFDVRDLTKQQYQSEIFDWAKDNILSPLELLSEAHENPTRGKEFTPSYPAQNQSEYSRWVAKCAPYVSLPWKERRGCKRLNHVMIEGGRKASRYPDAQWSGGEDLSPYPPDPKKSPSGLTRGGGPYAERRGRPPVGQLPKTAPGTKEGKAESVKTAQRLGGPNRPFHARTQSFLTRARGPASARQSKEASRRPGPVASGPTLEISRAIDLYRQTQPQGTLGFAVPTAVGPLIKAGMPEKAAHILVNRAARKFYPDVPYTSMIAVPLLSQLRQGLGPLVMESKKIVPDGPAYQLRIEGNFALGYLQEISVREGEKDWKKARAETLLDANADQIDQRYNVWREAVQASRTTTSQPGFYRREADDPAFLEELFNDVLLPHLVRLSEEWGSPNLILEFFFAPSGREFEVPFSAGEHSKLSTYEAVPENVDYRSLQNVSLSDLPRLLTRLSRRKKRKGRQLKPISSTRNNPSMNETSDNALLQLVFDKAYSPSPSLIPVHGKPGRVYWPITKVRSELGVKQRVPLGLKEVDERQARSWLKIAETGRLVGPELSDVASSLYAAGRTSRRPLLPGPTSTPAANNPARENPMSYWKKQYSKGPYGAKRSIPTARRNKGKKRTLSPAAKAKFSAVGTRAQEIAKASGCDMSAAMTQAWAEIKAGGQRAAANPWYNHDQLYLPDNPVRGAFVRAPYEWQDETEVFSALVPGPYTKNNPRKKPHWKSKGHPAYSKFQSRPRMANYEQVIGQFSTQEQMHRGMQPVNRRNPGNVMLGRFPGECCMCGGETRGAEIVKHPSMRGPKGGKKYAHVECM
jgi:hypothetical protein